MKTITDQLFAASNGLITLFPEVRDSAGHYHMADDGGVETEVGEFLYGLVKILQPARILETGTYTGISAMYMAAALQANNHGMLTTIEYEKTHKDRAERLWKVCGVSPFVECVLQSSLEYQPFGEFDLLFLDSEPQIRFQEVIKFFPYLKPGGFIGIHDLHRHLGQMPNEEHGFAWPWGPIPQEMMQLIKDDKLRVTSFPNPRGFTLLYKPREDDFKWERRLYV